MNVLIAQKYKQFFLCVLFWDLFLFTLKDNDLKFENVYQCLRAGSFRIYLKVAKNVQNEQNPDVTQNHSPP